MIWRTTEDALDLESLVIGKTQSAMYDDHPRTLVTLPVRLAHRREVLVPVHLPAMKRITGKRSIPFPRVVDMARPKGSTLSAEHKTALSAGRKMASVVSNYLEALEASKPKRGRKRTKDSIRNRLSTIENELSSADPLRRLQLVQEQMDLTAELEAADVATDFAKLESDFVKVAKTYSDTKGIS